MPPHARLDPDPLKMHIYGMSDLYYIAQKHRCHRDLAKHAKTPEQAERAAQVAKEAAQELSGRSLRYRAGYRDDADQYRGKPAREAHFTIAAAHSRRQIVTAAKAALGITGLALRRPTESWGSIEASNGPHWLHIMPKPLRPEDISDDEV